MRKFQGASSNFLSQIFASNKLNSLIYIEQNDVSNTMWGINVNFSRLDLHNIYVCKY